MTIKQRRARASRAAKQRGIIKAVKGLLKKTNPSAKITGARIVKLKGGGLTIRPLRANPAKAKCAVCGASRAEHKGRRMGHSYIAPGTKWRRA